MSLIVFKSTVHVLLPFLSSFFRGLVAVKAKILLYVKDKMPLGCWIS